MAARTLCLGLASDRACEGIRYFLWGGGRAPGLSRMVDEFLLSSLKTAEPVGEAISWQELPHRMISTTLDIRCLLDVLGLPRTVASPPQNSGNSLGMMQMIGWLMVEEAKLISSIATVLATFHMSFLCALSLLVLIMEHSLFNTQCSNLRPSQCSMLNASFIPARVLLQVVSLASTVTPRGTPPMLRRIGITTGIHVRSHVSPLCFDSCRRLPMAHCHHSHQPVGRYQPSIR